MPAAGQCEIVEFTSESRPKGSSSSAAQATWMWPPLPSAGGGDGGVTAAVGGQGGDRPAATPATGAEVRPSDDTMRHTGNAVSTAVPSSSVQRQHRVLLHVEVGERLRRAMFEV